MRQKSRFPIHVESTMSHAVKLCDRTHPPPTHLLVVISLYRHVCSMYVIGGEIDDVIVTIRKMCSTMTTRYLVGVGSNPDLLLETGRQPLSALVLYIVIVININFIASCIHYA